VRLPWLCLLILAAPAAAQDPDLRDAPDLGLDVAVSTAPAGPRATPFPGEAARLLGLEKDKLEAAEKQGFGRSEMLILSAVARQPGQKWEELLRKRREGARLRRLAEEAGLPYNDVFRRAQLDLQQVEKALAARSSGVKRSTAAVSGPPESPAPDPAVEVPE
jgi:hypothetical protein